MSSSSAVAVTNWSAAPASETAKVAVSPAVFPSSAACASVTACQLVQQVALKVCTAPLWITMLSLPALRLMFTATVPTGAWFRRTKIRPSPASRTLTADDRS